jgi:hypothetical protein
VSSAPSTVASSGLATPLRYRLPGIPARVVGGVLVGVGLLALLVLLPYVLLTQISALGVVSSVTFGLVAVAGTILAAIGGARHALRPTRLFGPLGLATALVGIDYLLLLRPVAVAALPPTHGVAIAIGYGSVLLWALALPILALVSAAISTVEDFSRPGERLAYDFPA